METALVPVAPAVPVTPITPTDNNEPLSSEVQPNKRRRKKSIVWDHFTIEQVGDGCTRACCMQCKKSFAYITGSKLAGTSHLKRHISMGICPVSRQKNQQTPEAKTGNSTYEPRKRYRAASGFANIPFNQELCNHELAKMIIMHDYPLNIVEHPGFVDFARTLQPQFNMVSFNSIQGDCVSIYLKEKQRLLNFISEIPGRVSLTLDLWTSDQTVGYVFLTGHFIDADWNLRRCLLNVVMVPSPDSEGALQQAVVACISDWNLENRLFALTLDQSFSNENINGSLRALFSVRNPYMFHGQLLVGNCFARVISLLAQEALWTLGQSVKKIRDSVKFVKTSDTHEETFIHLREQLKVPSMKDIFIDDQTKWNTTYDMLVAACELKQVFLCLETSIPDYKIAPSLDEWKQVEILCTYLKLFFDAVNILTAPTYPTASAFYHEVSKVQLELTHAAMSNDPFISNLIKPLKEKFDRYWSDCFLVLASAVVMDPRFKMKLVEFSFTRVYGDDAGIWIKTVDDGIHELYLEYIAQALPPPETFVEGGNASISHEGNGGISHEGGGISHEENGGINHEENGGISHEENGAISHEGNGGIIPEENGGIIAEGNGGIISEGNGGIISKGNGGIIPKTEPPEEGLSQEVSHQETHLEEVAPQDHLITIGDGLSDFEVYISEISGGQPMKSELDQYLEESLLPRINDFDILGWWNLNKTKYPTLSRMAADILSIPFSTVGPDSVFDTQRKNMDNYRSSLRPVTLEALICAKDWLQYGASRDSSSFVKMEF
ncbi:putative Zinc finger, BED-type [Corchorus capsularis]|uniref:Putative Zinc finger, BED-type n=1 Tax=Corchorus capsularis TaxID=210143 RepID=A0A1R3G8H1_COCAP|nr:putative Zinc finger, BED-type [Corchorus capsularis]